MLILTHFTAMSNFATKAFISENVTMIDPLEIIAFCDLNFGLLCISHFNQVLYDLCLY